jgi:hypothetical protein
MFMIMNNSKQKRKRENGGGRAATAPPPYVYLDIVSSVIVSPKHQDSDLGRCAHQFTSVSKGNNRGMFFTLVLTVELGLIFLKMA